MTRVVSSVLDRIGLLDTARSVRNALRVHGLTPWKPLVPERAFHECVRDAIAELKRREHEFGDYVEFGVSRGTSLACTWRALESSGIREVRMIGFDSFCGMHPDSAKEGWVPGDFASTEGATRRYLRSRQVPSEVVTLVAGWFHETATAETRARLKLDKVSIAMIDCDAYTPSTQALSFIADMIVDHAVIIFDDWGWSVKEGHVGQREAFSEFLAAHPELRAVQLASYREEARVYLLTREPAS
jgi:O-methyltransferase